MNRVLRGFLIVLVSAVISSLVATGVTALAKDYVDRERNMEHRVSELESKVEGFESGRTIKMADETRRALDDLDARLRALESLHRTNR